MSASPRFETIAMIGLGYIGLPTAAVFASRGNNVVGVDVSQHVVDTVNSGKIHIVEPGLDAMVAQAVKDGLLCATTEVKQADAYMIAVPTPFDVDPKTGEHTADLSYIEQAAKDIAPHLRPGNLVVLESTSPVGTTDQLAEWLAQARPDLTFPQTAGEESDVRIAHCPERVLPGQVVRELVENDRVVGGMTPACAEAAQALYKYIVEGDCLPTTTRTAEMVKLVENSFRDVNIAFANELSMICDELDINVWELITLANRHPRVSILAPGAGVGGHCIAVDPWFIVKATPETARIIRTARTVNDSKPDWVVDRVRELLNKVHRDDPNLRRNELTVACLGIAFKPDIDDLRESPALDVTEQVTRMGCQVLVVEPNIEVLPDNLQGSGAKLVPLDYALAQADVVCVLVKHHEFSINRGIIKSIERTLDVVGL